MSAIRSHLPSRRLARRLAATACVGALALPLVAAGPEEEGRGGTTSPEELRNEVRDEIRGSVLGNLLGNLLEAVDGGGR